MDEDTGAPEGAADDASFSIEDAVNAYSKAQQTDEAADTGQVEDDELPEEDGEAEDDLEDVEGESDDEDQADEDATDDQASDQGRFVADNAKVRLDDGSTVSIADLKRGSLLNADYTRKTQELADQRRSYESQSAQIRQKEAEYQDKLDQVDAFLNSMKPQQPDASLIDPNSGNYDPVAYMQQQARFQQLDQWVQYVQQQRQQAKQASQADEAKARQDQQAKFAEDMKTAMPELRDEKRARAFVTELNQHLPNYGFSPQEIDNLPPDARYFQVIRDAVKWRKLQASKGQPQKQKAGEPSIPPPPVQRGGKRLSANAQKVRRANSAMDRLKQSGSVDDAVAAYLANQKG